MPFVFILYFILYVIAFLDGTNIGFTIVPMHEELGFSYAALGLASGIFFIGYFIFQMPGTYLVDKIVTEGVERAPHRSLFKADGYGDEDLAKPLIAIANSWNEIVPGHIHLNEIARYVKEGVRAAGGTPMEFNTIAIDDGIAMGHEGMKYSLVSRETIADSVEEVVMAHGFDAVVLLASCDKT